MAVVVSAHLREAARRICRKTENGLSAQASADDVVRSERVT